MSFQLEQGARAALTRGSPQRSQSGTQARTSGVQHRTATLHKVGEVALQFSTKNDPTTGGVKVQKVLSSNAVAATPEQMLVWFSLRWPIEMFFNEMMSELGMCQYQFGPFARVVGGINLNVICCCYLEGSRWRKHKEVRGQEKGWWQRLRTAGLKEQVRPQVQHADLETPLRLAAADDGKQRLNALLDKVTGDPPATAV